MVGPALINQGEIAKQIQDFKTEVGQSLKEHNEDFEELTVQIENISSKISEIEENTSNISKKLDGLLIHFDVLGMCLQYKN